MNWYIAKVVFQIICGEGEHTPQFDEQLRVIAATGSSEAFHKALSIGKSEEDTFVNNNQKMVQWKFINVAELYKLSEMVDGAEIYSRIEEADSAENYTQLVNHKAEQLKKGLASHVLELY